MRSAPGEYIHFSPNLDFRTPPKPLPRLPRARYVSPASTRLCECNIFWFIRRNPCVAGRSSEGYEPSTDRHKGVFAVTGQGCACATPKGDLGISNRPRSQFCQLWIRSESLDSLEAAASTWVNVVGSCCTHAAVVPVPRGFAHRPRKSPSPSPSILSFITPPTPRLFLFSPEGFHLPPSLL